MLKLLGRWLKVYENEITLFVWTAVLLFLVRSSGMILNNYAETAFLKRFGVEYLPIVNMLNAVATFFIMGVMAGIMGRVQGAPLLTYLFIFCGVSVACIRFLIPFGIDLIYPVLFMLKAQYEVLLALLFWNLANDLFNMRQSKRLFPLITAGGVLGLIISSFGTPFIAKLFLFDNLLLVYLGICLVGALVVKGMSTRFPTLLLAEKKYKKTKGRTSMIDEFKKVLPLMKESILVKLMIVLTFMPNVVIPIMNYQFNFAVNEQFATETGLIQFFSYFRGILNIISLIILLFVGRIYGKWGLPVALIFHPFNYILAFLAFLLKFNYFSAMYARMSTNILRTTINIPSNAILMGLFPESYRGMVRPFLRGTVVRIGLFLGSGMILASQTLFHPRYLSLVALPFVGAWVTAPFILKKRYSKILLDLVSKNMIDLKSMEEKDVGHLFRDKKIQTQLIQAFLTSRGDDCLWYARLLKSFSVQDFDAHLLTKLKGVDDQTRIGLLELLSSQAGTEAIPVLRELADPEQPDLMVSLIRAVNRLAPKVSSGFDYEVFEKSKYPEVQAYAVVGLSRQAPQKYKVIIHSWLASEDSNLRKAGIIAASESGEASFVSGLRDILDAKDNDPVLPLLLKGLHKLEAPEMNSTTLPYLAHPEESVRLAAIEVFEINDDETLKKMISLLGDLSEKVYELAGKKIDNAPYHNGQILVESLNIPKRKVREGIFDLLESLDIKDLDVFRFARSQIEDSYHNLVEAEAVRLLSESSIRELIIDHLNQESRVKIENTLRVLAAQDRSGQMKIIYRGIFSSDIRQQANSQEALEDLMDVSLSKIMMPLLEGSSVSERINVGRKNFKLPRFDSEKSALLSYFLAKKDWLTVVLTLNIIAEQGMEGVDQGILFELTKSENSYIQQMAQHAMNRHKELPSNREKGMEKEITISDKILHLKGIELFEGLSISEFAAVASVTDEVVYPAGEIVIKEGDPGETMYLIASGEVSVIKSYGEDQEVRLDLVGAGEYFGEMALVDDIVRSATVRTEKESRFLVLHKQEFKEIVREYPQIALQICKALSGRIRKLHGKVKT